MQLPVSSMSPRLVFHCRKYSEKLTFICSVLVLSFDSFHGLPFMGSDFPIIWERCTIQFLLHIKSLPVCVVRNSSICNAKHSAFPPCHQGGDKSAQTDSCQDKIGGTNLLVRYISIENKSGL